MALRVAPSASFLHAFLPIARNTLFGPTVRRPLLERCRESLLPAIVIPIPSLVSDIWESVLRAVPKKKTSHMKKRHRQMAGKALKDVTALNTCSGCGRTKRAHILCPHCVASIKRWFTNDFTPETKADNEEVSNTKGPERTTLDVGSKPDSGKPAQA